MRTITVAAFTSLDGVVESPERWHMPCADEEMFAVMYPADSDMDTMLLGRTTYDSFAGAFAGAGPDDPVAARMNAPAKVVVTSSPETVTWANSTPLTGDVVAGVRALKERPGGSISVIGSTTLARTLLAAGLVDELSLLLHPLAVGKGARLFPHDGPAARFALAGCAPLRSGVVHLRYTA
ncbi:dihydrofolate reductase family protein [Spirilliplanes yamanashiensis]|uniref:Riboflavin biosynthesis protein RibD n=1 Tax=Spirilliplanes yamanashiensis TaxID=42233 RepID=A0A8J3Y6X8_9ACTN|nr:dihydrofolate reductase family protein [Spirilliplanes yamanashiensis]MDP9817343.1 dihydrofolate reductase [Spirilliplanes yamanashiensis]GIJ03006.1 riboflavin biosynthesis protein RibD [Spirilliplanes yamanashiensis]